MVFEMVLRLELPHTLFQIKPVALVIALQLCSCVTPLALGKICESYSGC